MVLIVARLDINMEFIKFRNNEDEVLIVARLDINFSFLSNLTLSPSINCS